MTGIHLHFHFQFTFKTVILHSLPFYTMGLKELSDKS